MQLDCAMGEFERTGPNQTPRLNINTAPSSHLPQTFPATALLRQLRPPCLYHPKKTKTTSPTPNRPAQAPITTPPLALYPKTTSRRHSTDAHQHLYRPRHHSHPFYDPRVRPPRTLLTMKTSPPYHGQLPKYPPTNTTASCCTSLAVLLS